MLAGQVREWKALVTKFKTMCVRGLFSWRNPHGGNRIWWGPHQIFINCVWLYFLERGKGCGPHDQAHFFLSIDFLPLIGRNLVEICHHGPHLIAFQKKADNVGTTPSFPNPFSEPNMPL